MLRLVLLSSWLLVGSLSAEDVPADPESVPGTVASANVTLELLGRGLIPTARVIITNTSATSVHFANSWTYEVIPQSGIIDTALKASLPAATDERHFTFDDAAFLPEQRVWLTLSRRTLFGSNGQDRIVISPRRSWGYDHLLDMRPGHFKPGPVLVRLCLATTGPISAWQRLLIPDVPDVPLVRFSGESRKLVGEVPFKRAAHEAGLTFIAVANSGAYPSTRILTLDTADPLAKHLPTLLLDGHSQHVFADGVRCRFAVRGVSAGGEVDHDLAVVVAVQPLE